MIHGFAGSNNWSICQWEAKLFLRTFNFMMFPLNRQTIPVTSIQLKVAVDFALKENL